MRALILCVVLFSSMIAFGCSENQAGGQCPLSKNGGWVDLFNGKDLAGWVEIGSKGSWSVENGILKCNGKKDKYAWLGTEKKYGKFVLEVEYRIGKGGNSGVFCLVPQYEGRSSMLGFEAQITDRTSGPLDENSPGSIFQRGVATSYPGKPAGQWNAMRIVCDGNNISTSINGVTVVELDKSKVENMKDVPDEGYIGLQNHDHPVEFRKVRLKKL